MELDFDSQVSGFEKYEDIYLCLLEKTFNHLGLSCEAILSVTLVDNKFIHQLNREYRNVDRPTDVISFAFLDGDEQRDEKLHGNDPVPLGDIYISVEKAKAQAEEYGHPLERELSFLFVHGLLHLLGYDHMTKEDEAVMFKLQDEILPPKEN
ncbi:MAG: rRNA maturation RNase YbeY [Bacilli bacterium]|nr:rRNA maturation RNase YbeY [Bacilli bacterium]